MVNFVYHARCEVTEQDTASGLELVSPHSLRSVRECLHDVSFEFYNTFHTVTCSLCGIGLFCISSIGLHVFFFLQMFAIRL